LKRAILFSIGFAAFTAVQVAWSLGHSFLGWRGAWIMKTGMGIAACFIVFAALSAFVTAWRFDPKALLKRALAVLAGAIVAMAVALMILGPGNLWPLVIMFDGAIILGALLFGGVVGSVVGTRRASAQPEET